MGLLVFLFWLFPFVEATFLILGWLRSRWSQHFRSRSGATFAVIQITTIGNYETVNEIIEKVRSYCLPFKYEFWVITEPGVANHYEGADFVYQVPADFKAKSLYKARAQEYSRLVRKWRGLNRRDVKVIFIDDDALPTSGYLLKAFNADYDICEGILTPRRTYGRFISHLDDVRTQNCLVICSFWQGIGHPVWVHGEGLCFRGDAEDKVTWDYPVVASEDLTVGHNSLDVGLKWGFIWEYVQITSPWSIRDFVTQRRRWLWGNVFALRNGLIPPLGAFLVTSRWLIGLICESVVLAGLFLVPLAVWRVPSGFQELLYTSLGVWLSTFAIGCWISSKEPGVGLGKRILNTLVGTALTPITLAASSFVTFYCLALGPTGKFDVISKAPEK
jgi:hypothetical protein